MFILLTGESGQGGGVDVGAFDVDDDVIEKVSEDDFVDDVSDDVAEGVGLLNSTFVSLKGLYFFVLNWGVLL